ncbi:MAG: heavy metal-associated domain-containing protein [Hyphomicrobiales bacterium]
MISLMVTGMTCQGCARSVKGAIGAIDEGAAVEIDLATGKVDIDSGKPVEPFVAAIEKAGFDVAR